MPSRAVVEQFIATIERGGFLEALSQFYAEDMTAQENNQLPRVGRAAQFANEEAALKRMHFDAIEGPRMAKSIALAADASRLASLLLSYIPAVCALVAPRQPGASTA
ncbi:MAG TPA: hypothetical protein VIK01_16495, partial [Polyangiaceae bacterium]